MNYKINQNSAGSDAYTLCCDTVGASIIKNSYRQLINIFFDDMGAYMWQVGALAVSSFLQSFCNGQYHMMHCARTYCMCTIL
jgi:hypothetical protein